MRRLLFLLSIILLSACSSGDDAAGTMQSYLAARAQADATRMQSLSCAAWESQALIQAQSFRSMNAELDGVMCHSIGAEGGYELVQCDGRILTSYNGENREWALGTYRMIKEDGEWRMCGEAEAPPIP